MSPTSKDRRIIKYFFAGQDWRFWEIGQLKKKIPSAGTKGIFKQVITG